MTGSTDMESIDSDQPDLPTSEEEDILIMNDHLTVLIPEGMKAPTRGSSGSAGWDLRANQSLTLQPGSSAKIDLGLRAAIPAGHCLLLMSRSKLASQGITVEGGLIDSDYRGPILAILHNSSPDPRRILKGERIAQSIFLPTPEVTWTHVTDLDRTDRGSRGFGSTGSH